MALPDPSMGVLTDPNLRLAASPEELEEVTTEPALATPMTKSERAVYFIFFELLNV